MGHGVHKNRFTKPEILTFHWSSFAGMGQWLSFDIPTARVKVIKRNVLRRITLIMQLVLIPFQSLILFEECSRAFRYAERRFLISIDRRP